MLCCGTEQPTRFCPHCGKELVPENSLRTLLAHLRVLQSRTEAQAETWAARKSTSEREKRADARKVRAAAKWKAWADALEAMLAKTDGTNEPDPKE